MLLHLLKIPPNLPNQIFWDLLVQQILVNMQYFLLELRLNCIGPSHDSFYGSDHIGENSTGHQHGKHGE
jgi:hypothetical protein